MINEEKIEAIQEDIIEVLKCFQEMDEEMEENHGTVDMCSAMKQIIAEESDKAVKVAILRANIKWMEKGKLTAKEAAEECGMSEKEFLQKVEEYKDEATN